MTRCFFSSSFYLCDENVAFCPIKVTPLLREKKSKRKEEDKMSESKSASGEASSKRDGFDGKTTRGTSATKNFDQSFESILHLEQKFTEIGFQNGKTDGEIKGEEEGEQIGFLEGYAIGAEIGHYLGALRAWEGAVMDDNATTIMDERKRERIRVAVRQLETALGDIARGFDTDDNDVDNDDKNLDEDFTEKLERARACFRKCTASLGVHGKYKGFTEEEIGEEDGAAAAVVF